MRGHPARQLPTLLLDILKWIHAVVGHYIEPTLEKWELGFMREWHVVKEVMIWHRFAFAFVTYHRRELWPTCGRRRGAIGWIILRVGGSRPANPRQRRGPVHSRMLSVPRRMGRRKNQDPGRAEFAESSMDASQPHRMEAVTRFASPNRRPARRPHQTTSGGQQDGRLSQARNGQRSPRPWARRRKRRRVPLGEL